MPINKQEETPGGEQEEGLRKEASQIIEGENRKLDPRLEEMGFIEVVTIEDEGEKDLKN